MIVARLMHVLVNESGDGEHSPLKFMRFYTCIEPECTFMSYWTLVFIVLLMYIMSLYC